MPVARNPSQVRRQARRTAAALRTDKLPPADDLQKEDIILAAEHVEGDRSPNARNRESPWPRDVCNDFPDQRGKLESRYTNFEIRFPNPKNRFFLP
jgi:hypothetical protein